MNHITKYSYAFLTGISILSLLENNRECDAICPKEAIFMVEDEEGFEYPQIDSCFSGYQRYSMHFTSWTDETLGNRTGCFGSKEAAEYSVCCN